MSRLILVVEDQEDNRQILRDYRQETRMASRDRWFDALIGAALLCASSSMPATTSWAQQSGAQPPAVPRDDPATSGAGPTSGAPGQLDYGAPKGAPPSAFPTRTAGVNR